MFFSWNGFETFQMVQPFTKYQCMSSLVWHTTALGSLLLLHFQDWCTSSWVGHAPFLQVIRGSCQHSLAKPYHRLYLCPNVYSHITSQLVLPVWWCLNEAPGGGRFPYKARLSVPIKVWRLTQNNVIISYQWLRGLTTILLVIFGASFLVSCLLLCPKESPIG